MGANGSSEAEEYVINNRGQRHQPGKPLSPEGIPKVYEITHNSLMVSWMPPMYSGNILAYHVECCNVKDKKWKVVSGTCQGTHHHVRNLVPNTHYAFRVRAENIYGLGKPGHISNVIETQSAVCGQSTAKPSTKLVRRHSHYLRLDGGINLLLNGVDEKSEPNTVGTIPFRRNSMRGSLPATFRKRNSVTSMLPGSRRESVCNMKESKKSFEDSSSVADEEGVNLKRISMSSTEGSSILSATSMSSIPEDEELKELYGNHFDISSDNDDASSVANSQISHSSSTNSTHSTSSHSSSSSTSNFFTASITDDTKLSYYSSSNSEKQYYSQCPDIYSEKIGNQGKFYDHCNNETVWKGHDELDNRSHGKNVPDLRTIRDMLHSQDVMVKTLDSVDNSYPNYLNTRRTHCAIKEIDEEHVAMDIVSTI